MKSRRGRPPGTTGRAAVLTPEQIQIALATARSRPQLSWRAVIALSVSFGLGLRAKELCALLWADVFDPNGRPREILHLKAAYTKGSRTRDVYLAAEWLRKTLKLYYLDRRPRSLETPLLPSRLGGHLTPTSMARFLKQIYVEAGLPKASSHSGRRTMITHLAEKGIDLKAISALAGHSNVRTTALYDENNPTRLARIQGEVAW